MKTALSFVQFLKDKTGFPVHAPTYRETVKRLWFRFGQALARESTVTRDRPLKCRCKSHTIITLTVDPGPGALTLAR